MKDEDTLFLVMNAFWYWKVYRGVKPVEYRSKSPKNMRIGKRDYKKVKLQLGYNKHNVIILEIEKIEETEDEFQIHMLWNTMQIISFKEPAPNKPRKKVKVLL